MSDTRPGEIVLVPSRTRRHLLVTAAAVTAALAVALGSAAAPAAPGAAGAAAGLCLLASVLALLQAGGAPALRCIRLAPDTPVRGEAVGPARIVFFAAQRRIVVWHDATDPVTFRRLAVLARWPARGQSR